MKIRINIYLITAILVLTPNLLARCEGGPSYDDRSDRLNHLVRSEYLDGQGPEDHESMTQYRTSSLRSSNFGHNDGGDDDDDNNKVMTRPGGNTMTQYETTTRTDQDTNNNGSFDDQSMSSDMPPPGAYTKVIKKTIVKRTRNGENYGSKESGPNGMDTVNLPYGARTVTEIERSAKTGMPPPMPPSQQIPGPPGGSQNVMKTIVTKTTTSGLPSPGGDFDGGSIRQIRLHGLKSMPTDGRPDLAGGRIVETVSTTTDSIDGNGFDGMDERRALRKPEGSFGRARETMMKRQGKNGDNDIGDLVDGRGDGFDYANEISSGNNMAGSAVNPSEYGRFVTASTTNSARPMPVKNSSLKPDSFGRTPTTLAERREGGSNYLGSNLNDYAYNNDDGKTYSSRVNTNSGSMVSSNRFDDNDNNNGYGVMDYSDNVKPMSGAPNSFGNSHGSHHKRKTHHHRCKCADKVQGAAGPAVILDRNVQSYGTEYGNGGMGDGMRNVNSQTYASKAYGVTPPAEFPENYSQGSVAQQGIAVLPRHSSSRKRKSNRTTYASGSGNNDVGGSQELGPLSGYLPPLPFHGLPLHGQPPFGLLPPFGSPPTGPPPFGGSPPIGPPPFGGSPPIGPPPFGGSPPIGPPPFGGSPPIGPPPFGSQNPNLSNFQTTNVVSQYSPYGKQEQYSGSLGKEVGNSFDSYNILNKTPPMPDRYQRLFGQNPYPSFLDHIKSFSTTGPEEMYSSLLSPGNMFTQRELENQINSNMESSRTQQGGSGSDSELNNLTDALKSESTTTKTQSSLVSTDGQPFKGYTKTIKTIETVNGDNPPEISVFKTESVIPAVDGNN